MSIEVVNVRSYRPMFKDTRVYIGRSTSWKRVSDKIDNCINMSALGNPYPVNYKDTNSRKESIERYEKYFNEQVQKKGRFRSCVGDLYRMFMDNKSIKLICFCAPDKCHGDIIKSFIIYHGGSNA
jgi:hypothetical protein